MPRPRLYPDSAARQAAYRRRLRADTVVVDRRRFDYLHQRLETLRDAVHEAARHGDPLAKECLAGSSDTTIDKLIAAFQSRGGAKNTKM
jgi:hypothetical protein